MPSSAWPLSPLRRRHFRTLLVDPPWAFRARSDKGLARAPQRHYPCMPLAEICALPVGELAHPEGCALLLWFSSPFLPHAQACLTAWGFDYVAMGAWAKLTASGDPAMGLGYWYRSAAEFWFLAKRGRVTRGDRGVPNLILAPRREHSRKPDAMHAIHRRMLVGPRAELFARETRRGWSAFGNQTDRFPPS